MDGLKRVLPEVLVQETRELFEACMREVMEAVNAAPTGRLIEGSEVQVHALMRQFERQVYEAALQARIDASEEAAAKSDAAFSPSAGGAGGAGGGRAGA